MPEFRDHDLETTGQIAEFTFIQWRGGAESMRQNRIFVDLFKLAREDKPKGVRRVLYVVGKKYPEMFFANSRSLTSVLGHSEAAKLFRKLYGDEFKTVDKYYAFATQEKSAWRFAT